MLGLQGHVQDWTEKRKTNSLLTNQETSLDEVTNQIWDELKKRWFMVDYRDTAFVANRRLRMLLELLEMRDARLVLSNPVGSPDVLYSLGMIWRTLGDFQAALSVFMAMFPGLEKYPYDRLRESLSAIFSAKASQRSISSGSSVNFYKLESLFRILELLVDTGKDLDLKLAEAVVKVLPSLLPQTRETTERVVCLAMKILTKQSKISEAIGQLNALNAMFRDPWQSKIYSLFLLQRAICATKTVQTGLTELPRDFERVLVTSYVNFQVWGVSTLYILYHFGKTLLQLETPKAAAVILEECFLGCSHVYGTEHPYYRQAFKAIKACKISPSHLRRLQRYGHPDLDREKQLSIAYEHCHLNTSIDLLQKAATDTFSYQTILHTLGFITRASVNLIRTIAGCVFEQGQMEQARSYLRPRIYSYPTSLYNGDNLVMELDLVKYSDDRLRSARDLLRRCHTELPFQHQHTAVHRKLTAAGLTHFPYDMLKEDPPLIVDGDSEMLRQGAYAVVDTIKIGGKLYARKSIKLPCYHQQRVRDTIQNEVSIMRALEHPHIIQLYLTYEEKPRFCIVMEPLADCDLEIFFEQDTEQPRLNERRKMIWRWFLCLVNALAYIHFESVRHKDIKPRNILVRGKEIIFGDFGSSHAFFNLDYGKSTTEGPAFGHTKMYSAPEVLANGKRGRKADIFSLGCVFTEMTVWLIGVKH